MSVVLTLLLFVAVSTTLIPPPFSHTLGFNRISPFYINMFLGADFRLDNPQGLACAKIKEEEDTTTWRDDALLTLFAVNAGTGQIVYNIKLRRVRVFGSEGSGVGQFKNPQGITCNEAGDVFVADRDNNRLVRLRYANGELNWVAVVDSNLNLPYDVTMDSKGYVYVTDTRLGVAVYAPDSARGKSLPLLGKGNCPGLEQPTAIAILDRYAQFNETGQDFFVVVDRFGTRINQLSLSGEIKRSIDCRRIGLDSADFAYCAFDRHGNLYVTDRLNSQIHIFDPGLKYITSFGRGSTSSPGEPVFNSPRGIAIGRKFGQVFISEADGGQYYLIALDGHLIGCFPEVLNSERPGTTIAFYLTQRAEIVIEITDALNNLVRNLTPVHQQGPGEVLIAWDGRDNQGGFVPPGEYLINITLRPTYSYPRSTMKKQLITRLRKLPG